MAYKTPEQKRDIQRKVRFNQTLDRILTRASHKAEKQHGTYLHLLIEWAVENGAIEELMKGYIEEQRSRA